MQSEDSASEKTNVEPNHEVVGSPPARSGESTVIWTLWLTYGAFYFCRVNISAVVPGLKASVEDGGLGIGADTIGWILGSLKITYALGQLINGQLSEQLPPRKMLAIVSELSMYQATAIKLEQVCSVSKQLDRILCQKI